jgi:hypothetical protein
MNIFLAIVMGPGLGFMVYALVQFWREERLVVRSRLKLAAASGVPNVTSGVPKATSLPASQHEYEFRSRAIGQKVIVIGQPVSRRSSERDVA